MILSIDNINEVELELTGKCNLACKLCFSTQSIFKDKILFKQRPLLDIIKLLDKFKKLLRLLLAGLGSEPTLYPKIIELIEYANSRNLIIEVYSNGNTHNTEWWRLFGKKLKLTDKCIFTVCGSTQALHEKYRVGSNLLLILDNAAAFREAGNKNDYCLHILFEYNKDDLASGNMNYIFNQFSHIWKINSSAYNERFNFLNNTDICMIKTLSDKYKIISAAAKKLKYNKCIQCKSIELHMVTIDNFGNIYPCYIYRLFSNDVFENNEMLNYNSILDYKYDFCFECEKKIHALLNANNMQRMM